MNGISKNIKNLKPAIPALKFLLIALILAGCVREIESDQDIAFEQQFKIYKDAHEEINSKIDEYTFQSLVEIYGAPNEIISYCELRKMSGEDIPEEYFLRCYWKDLGIYLSVDFDHKLNALGAQLSFRNSPG